MRRVGAVIVFLMAFGVFFFDQLYRLGSAEWVPEVLGPLLITAAMYLWQPSWWRGGKPD